MKYINLYMHIYIYIYIYICIYLHIYRERLGPDDSLPYHRSNSANKWPLLADMYTDIHILFI